MFGFDKSEKGRSKGGPDRRKCQCEKRSTARDEPPPIGQTESRKPMACGSGKLDHPKYRVTETLFFCREPKRQGRGERRGGGIPQTTKKTPRGEGYGDQDHHHLLSYNFI